MKLILVKTLKPEMATRWDSFVHSFEYSVIYQLSVWETILQNTYNLGTFFLYAEENDKIKGILPLVHLKSLLFGSQLVSMPFATYGGLLSDDTETTKLLFEKAKELAKELKCDSLEIRNDRIISEQYFPESILNECVNSSTNKVCMNLMLPDSSDELFNSFKSKLRSQIRRPEKEGMTFVMGGLELINDFYSVFSLNMRDLGSPVHSKQFFINIMQELEDKVQVGIVYYSHKPVASGIIFLHNQKVEIPWASTLRKYNKYSPNMLLYWSFLKYVADNGYKSFDFGRSTKDVGTYRFKKQWGAMPTELYWLKFPGSKIKDNIENNTESKTNKLLIKIWQQIPLTIANIIGPKIRPNISL